MRLQAFLIIILVFICNAQFYSQKISKERKEHHKRIRKNSKGLALKVSDFILLEKNGKSSWAGKAAIYNKTRDTLFYFITPNCEASGFLVMAFADSVSLFADFEPCTNANKIIVAIPPKGKRVIDLVISSTRPVTSPGKFIVFLSAFKAKNGSEPNPNYNKIRKEVDREIWLQSNKIKI